MMMMYIGEAVDHHSPNSRRELREAIMEGAVLRVRPKAMTSATVVLGLTPLLIGGGPGSEAMERIAAPMVGGMITAPRVSLLLIPVCYWLWHRRNWPKMQD